MLKSVVEAWNKGKRLQCRCCCKCPACATVCLVLRFGHVAFRIPIFEDRKWACRCIVLVIFRFITNLVMIGTNRCFLFKLLATLHLSIFNAWPQRLSLCCSFHKLFLSQIWKLVDCHHKCRVRVRIVLLNYSQVFPKYLKSRLVLRSTAEGLAVRGHKVHVLYRCIYALWHVA